MACYLSSSQLIICSVTFDIRTKECAIVLRVPRKCIMKIWYGSSISCLFRSLFSFDFAWMFAYGRDKSAGFMFRFHNSTFIIRQIQFQHFPLLKNGSLNIFWRVRNMIDPDRRPPTCDKICKITNFKCFQSAKIGP